MAGSTVDWKTTKTLQGAGKLWRGLAIPGAAARLTLFTDGTPDATANPSAKHLGATKAGSKCSSKGSYQKFNVDEIVAPVITNVDTQEMMIAGELVGITDMALATYLMPGVGSNVTASGYDQVTFGSTGTITYDSFALIAQLIEDTTKYGVFHIYSGVNTSGIEFSVGRKEMSFTPFNIEAYAITSRAATDQYGTWWKQA